ncbi:MAG: FAD-dependent oxidoreductase [Trueperaceae bacterium]|nr:MAG: FAD-dependent oxidoreductase [Trueperaceae bacterium]
MSASAESTVRVAIIGAGPSGFYAADALLKSDRDVSVDLYDKLPTPYGLVRYGVAPDHQKIKSVIRLYERTCKDPRLRFLGNVTFGRDLTVEDIKAHYHAIIYTVGSPADRNLGIPGETLPGSMSATEFVAWYNGHPDYTDLEPDLSAQSVAVIGMGNVAVDVTRILAKSVDELRTTDIADHALEALAESQVKDIYMIGRRGPAQGKFTTKELRELGELENADIIVHPFELAVDEASLTSIEGDAIAMKNLEVLRLFAAKEPEGKARRVHLRFLFSPVEIHGNGHVNAIKLERNRLEQTESGYISAVGCDVYEELIVQLVFRSVGYRGEPLPGVPFDERRNTIPHHEGRVLERPGGDPVPGSYVAGWIKRGPTGVIGTNKADAMETVKSLLADTLPEVPTERSNPQAILDLLAFKGVRYCTLEGWQALDKIELEAGAAQGRPRVKVTALEEMLEHTGVDR